MSTRRSVITAKQTIVPLIVVTFIFGINGFSFSAPQTNAQQDNIENLPPNCTTESDGEIRELLLSLNRLSGSLKNQITEPEALRNTLEQIRQTLDRLSELNARQTAINRQCTNDILQSILDLNIPGVSSDDERPLQQQFYDVIQQFGEISREQTDAITILQQALEPLDRAIEQTKALIDTVLFIQRTIQTLHAVLKDLVDSLPDLARILNPVISFLQNIIGQITTDVVFALTTTIIQIEGIKLDLKNQTNETYSELTQRVQEEFFSRPDIRTVEARLERITNLCSRANTSFSSANSLIERAGGRFISLVSSARGIRNRLLENRNINANTPVQSSIQSNTTQIPEPDGDAFTGRQREITSAAQTTQAACQRLIKIFQSRIERIEARQDIELEAFSRRIIAFQNNLANQGMSNFQAQLEQYHATLTEMKTDVETLIDILNLPYSEFASSIHEIQNLLDNLESAQDNIRQLNNSSAPADYRFNSFLNIAEYTTQLLEQTFETFKELLDDIELQITQETVTE